VAHSNTLVALLSSVWISEASGSSGSSAASFERLTEKSVPATLAVSLADCELHSHKLLAWTNRGKLGMFCDFFLFTELER
jgi:hypothetical protein